MHLWIIASSFLFTAVLAEQLQGYDGYPVYAVSFDTEEQLDFFLKLHDAIDALGIRHEVEFFTQPSMHNLRQKKPILMMVAPSRKDHLLRSLNERHITYEVTILDVGREIQEQAMRNRKEMEKAVTFPRMSWTAYHTSLTIERYLLELEKNYPEIVSYTNLGKSYEGRNLNLLKVGMPRNDGRQKPAIWIDSLIHSREWISGATTTYMLNKLVTEYSTNATTKKMLDELDFFFMPVANPDGYDYSHSSDSTRLWRRSRRVNPFHESCVGVDGNRNYDFHWMELGAKQDPCSETFAGQYGFSEPENLVLAEAVLERKDVIKAYLTFHSAAQGFLIPWGYTGESLPDYREHVDLGKRAVEALYSQFNTTFVADSLFVLGGQLSLSAGASDDWAKGKAGTSYVYTIELRDQGTYGFLLPPDQIIPSGIETFEALVVIADTVAKQFGLTPN